jgi:hypothetical protein
MSSLSLQLQAATHGEQQRGNLPKLQGALRLVEELGEKSEELTLPTRQFLARWAAMALEVPAPVVRRDDALALPSTYAEWLELNLSAEEARGITVDSTVAHEFIRLMPNPTFYDLMARYRHAIEVEVYGNGSLDDLLAARGETPASIDDVFAIVLAVYTERVVDEELISRIEKRSLDQTVQSLAAKQSDPKRI